MYFVEKLKQTNACKPAMAWVAENSHLSPKTLWETCPDGSWMAWALGLPEVRKHLPDVAVAALREWAMWCARRVLTVHAPSALTAAAACHPIEEHRNEMLTHAERLAGIALNGAAAAAARAAAAAYAAARAADAAAYAAADAAARAAASAADARAYAAARAADAAAYAAASAASSAELKAQADELRACFRWEWVEEALAGAGIDLRASAEDASSPH